MKELISDNLNVVSNLILFNNISSFLSKEEYGIHRNRKSYNKAIRLLLKQENEYTGKNTDLKPMKNNNYVNIKKEIDSSNLDNPLVLKFVNKVKNNFGDCLGYMYSNLMYLDVKSEDKPTEVSTNLILATYDINNNVLVYSKGYEKSVFHELFHMASSYSVASNLNYSGFRCNYYNNIIGTALNEGYTEFLSNRYFGNNSDKSYEFEKMIVFNIENIIGKEKMESLYMKADLVGLVNELSLYENEEKILDIIRKMDFLELLDLNMIYTDNRYDKHRAKIAEYIQDSVVKMAVNKGVNFDSKPFTIETFDTYRGVKLHDPLLYCKDEVIKDKKIKILEHEK